MIPPSILEFEESVRTAIDPVALPSIAYGIARGGETILLGAAGLADKAGVESTPQTPYALASITKPVSATAVAILAERRLVDLDAPIETYLGGLHLDGKAGDPQQATVRRVMNHTAGLPTHYRFYYADENPVPRPFKEVVAQYGKLFSAPGERFRYSNLGYGLLDALVANVSGKPYAEFMAKEVFAPLGMTGASINPRPGAAVGYGPDGLAYPPYDTDHPGGSAAFASVEDLLAFGRFHLGGNPSILSRAGREAMQIPTFGYGLGWSVGERHGLLLVEHTGGMGGVSTILRLVPALDLVVAVVANGEEHVPMRLADETLAALDAGFREGHRTTRSTSAEPAPPPTLPEGLWSGFIETPEDQLPFALEIRDAIRLARLDGNEFAVDEVQFVNGRLRGAFKGGFDTPDVAGRTAQIVLDLAPRDGRLDGAATALTESTERGQRVGDALAYWTELERL